MDSSDFFFFLEDENTEAKFNELCGRERAGGGLVFTCKGAAMQNKADALAEMARILQFPDYFGGNFNALYDCMTDLAWLPPFTSVLLRFTDADMILEGSADSVDHNSADDVNDQEAFWSLLTDVCAFWNAPFQPDKEWGHTAIPFRIFLQRRETSSADFELFLKKLFPARIYSRPF